MRTFLLALVAGLAVHASAQDPAFTSARGPFAGGRVVAALDDGRVLGIGYRTLHASVDGGETWAPVALAPPLDEVSPLPTGGLLGKGPGGYARSDDGGATWRPVATPAAGTIVVAPDGSPWYHYTSARALHRSDDEGATWTHVVDFGSSSTLSAVAASDDVLVIMRGSGFNGPAFMFRSADGGRSWAAVSLPSLAYPSNVQRLLRTRDGALYGISYENDPDAWANPRSPGLFRSTNGGASWSIVSTANVTGVFVTADGRRLIGRPDTLDGGPPGFRAAASTSFVEASDGTLYVNSQDLTIPHYELSEDVWAGTGAHRWDPGRGMWAQVGIEYAPVQRLERDGAGRLLAGYVQRRTWWGGTTKGAVLRVENEAWGAAGFNRAGVQGLLTIGDGRTLIADQELGVSVLGGTSVSPWGCELPGPASYALGQTASGALLAFYPFPHPQPFPGPGSLCRSVDVHTWAEVLGDVVIRVIAAAPDGPVYAGTSPWDHGDSHAALYRSLDDGLTWQPLAPPDARTTALLGRPGGEVFLGTPAGVYRSADGGDSWAPDGLSADSVFAFASSAAGVLAGTRSGLFLRDGGVWRPFGSGLAGRPVYAIRAEPTATGERLIVGTDRGVYATEPLVNTPAEGGPVRLPAQLSIRGVRPHPVRGAAAVAVEVPAEAHVRLVLLDVLGRELAVLLDARLAAGTHDLPVRVEAPAGTYLLRLTADGDGAAQVVSVSR